MQHLDKVEIASVAQRYRERATVLAEKKNDKVGQRDVDKSIYISILLAFDDIKHI